MDTVGEALEFRQCVVGLGVLEQSHRSPQETPLGGRPVLLDQPLDTRPPRGARRAHVRVVDRHLTRSYQARPGPSVQIRTGDSSGKALPAGVESYVFDPGDGGIGSAGSGQYTRDK